MLAGGSTETFYLAKLLQQHGVQAIAVVEDRARAQELRAEYRRYDAVARATRLIEQLASTGRPVLRSGAEMSLVPVAAPAQGD